MHIKNPEAFKGLRMTTEQLKKLAVVNATTCSALNLTQIFLTSYLDARKDHKQFDGEMGQLKHHAAAFCTPFLLPLV